MGVRFMTDLKTILDTDSLFRALCDETRRRCVVLMMHEGESCVCELTHALELSQPKISRHLAALKKSGLVLDRREGQWVYYRVDPQIPDWMQVILQNMAQATAQELPYSLDAKRLSEMENRPIRCC